MFILDILLNNGYESWRRSQIYPSQNASARIQNEMLLKTKEIIFLEGNEKNGVFFWKHKINDFSSMLVGGIDIYLTKSKDFRNSVIWGLHEKDKPPTLISPRPKIRKIVTKTILEWRKDNFFIPGEDNKEVTIELNERYDDIMNECLNTFEHFLIYDSIINNSNKVFNLNTKTIQ